LLGGRLAFSPCHHHWANEADVEQVADLLHGKGEQVWADSGYRAAPARVDREDLWHIADRPSDIAKLPEGRAKNKVQQSEHGKASIRAKVAVVQTYFVEH
jgi:transposase, IS5 family